MHYTSDGEPRPNYDPNEDPDINEDIDTNKVEAVDTAEPTVRRSRPTREDRPDIVMADGRVFRPRYRIAAGAGVNERTLRRKHGEVVYIGGLAYCEVNSAISDLVGKPLRRNAPVKRRRTTTTKHQMEA
jgi:hypothetical protein